MFEKLKSFLEDDVVYFSLLLILVAVVAFGLGKSSGGTVAAAPEQVRVEYTPLVAGAAASNPTSLTQTGSEVVASKNGTKYHLPSCPGAAQIAEQNLITFASEADAKAAGYTPAANCKF